MKNRLVSTIISLVVGLTVVACGNTTNKSNNGLELLYFGKKVEIQEESNIQKRARFLPLSADEIEEQENNSVTDLSYGEDFTIEAQVKNEKRLSFVDIVISSGSNNQKYVFNEGNGQYQCQTTTVFRDEMWITDITIPIDFSLIDKDTDSYKCFIDTYLEVEEITFLNLTGNDAKADIKADVKKLSLKCEGEPDNHVWEMNQSADGSIDIACTSCHKNQYGLQIDTTNNTVKYGAYPQTVVTNASTIEALDAMRSPFLNEWYYYNGCFYAKQTAKPKGTNATFNNGEIIESNKTYWFKCEPITWRIINTNDNGYYLLSSLVLETHRYDENTYIYKDSEIRSWLNNEFYNSAFALHNSYVRITDVDNSELQNSTNDSSLACENTHDRVFLPSYQECRSISGLYTEATDWVKSNENSSTTSWTRSPEYSYVISGVTSSYVSTFPGASSKPIHFSMGVRPAITLLIAKQ